MVLEDIPRDPGAVEVGRAIFEPDRFRDRDLHLLDVPIVPERLEDSVAQAKDQDVLDGFLAEVVIDAVDLALVKHRVDERVQLARGFEIVPKGLLDDHA